MLKRRNEVVELETHVTTGSKSLIVLVKGHGTVCDFGLLVNGEDFCLSEVLEDVAHAEHDHRVTNDKDALTTVIAGDHLGRAAQPENDVAPAFSSRWTVIELSEQAAVLGLLGELLLDPDVGEPIENAKLLLAEPFVDEERIGILRDSRGLDDEAGGVARAQIGRRQYDVGTILWRQRPEPISKRDRLAFSELREWDIDVADAEVDY